MKVVGSGVAAVPEIDAILAGQAAKSNAEGT
jgi:hypothetical protein